MVILFGLCIVLLRKCKNESGDRYVSGRYSQKVLLAEGQKKFCKILVIVQWPSALWVKIHFLYIDI